MVRETRLQKLLKERGGGRYEQYTEMVAQRYNSIIAAEHTDTDDKFEVQEANRRARDQVREELLAEAPDYIKAEIEGEINMGDSAWPGVDLATSALFTTCLTLLPHAALADVRIETPPPRSEKPERRREGQRGPRQEKEEGQRRALIV